MSSDEGAARAGPDRPLPEDYVADRVKLEREARGWSTVTLAEKMAEAGHPVNQSAIWRIESGKPRRRVNLDEALGFCKVFDLTLDDLTSPPGQLANAHVRRLIAQYVANWREWSVLNKDMRRILAELKEYTDANPNQEDLVKGLLGHEVAVAAEGRFHRHFPPPKLVSYLGEHMDKINKKD
ncbi:helix-turn-helix domain-containing protein [Streptomyces bambusae]|uniref:XRE family transcriptional regulator n=1 Tax=Streptomyces bambusae TaxID=1550616 RepID=A0ABS6Z1L8_9ACTN|nr:helix-turn-helix transcriptional regulator [Streptomyces bambusae]MBW5481143.1 XRE family transcriptional regulator [Streptomyces bambusae]